MKSKQKRREKQKRQQAGREPGGAGGTVMVNTCLSAEELLVPAVGEMGEDERGEKSCMEKDKEENRRDEHKRNIFVYLVPQYRFSAN